MSNLYKLGPMFLISILALQPIQTVLSAEQSAGVSAKQSQSVATYPIGPGDVLEIVVRKEEEMERVITVPPDGVISFPLAGSFKVLGLTIDQIEDELEKRLAEVIIDPIVNVAVRSFASHKIYVIGKVNAPGELLLTGPTDVMQALALAGGMAQFADLDDINILRRIDGKLITISFDFSEVADGENLEQNIILQKGDVLVVQ